MKKIGAKLKKIRELKGYSQEYVAECLHVSSSTISRMETNFEAVKFGQIVSYCSILDITIEDLFAQDAKIKDIPIRLCLNVETKDIHCLLEIHDALSEIIKKWNL